MADPKKASSRPKRGSSSKEPNGGHAGPDRARANHANGVKAARTRALGLLGRAHRLIGTCLSEAAAGDLGEAHAETLVRILGAIQHIENRILNHDPSLAAKSLRPAARVNVRRLAAAYDATRDSEAREAVLRQLVDVAPVEIYGGSNVASLTLKGVRRLLRWARNGPRSMPRVTQLNRLLDSPHRWVRYHAGRALLDATGEDLLRVGASDVDADLVQRWRARRAAPRGSGGGVDASQ